jgi:hypothetical protein
MYADVCSLTIETAMYVDVPCNIHQHTSYLRFTMYVDVCTLMIETAMYVDVCECVQISVPMYADV